MNNKQPRFIAGAVCPECGHMDSLTMTSTDQGMMQKCVDCNYSKVLNETIATTEPKIFFSAKHDDPSELV